MGVSVYIRFCPQQSVNQAIQGVWGTWAFVVTPVKHSFHAGDKLLFPERAFQET